MPLTPEQQAALVREHTDGFDVQDEVDTPLEPRASAPVVGSAPPAGPGTPGGAAAPTKPQHPATLLAMARQLGFSAEDIANTPTAELRADVELLARIQREGSVQTAQRQQPVTVTGSQPAPEPPAPKPSVLGSYKGKFDPEFEDALENVLNGIVKPLQDELAATKKQLGDFGGHVEQARQQSQTDRVDAAFAALGKRFEKIYGVGSGRDMQATDPNWIRRNNILGLAGVDFSKPLPAVAEIVDRIQKATVAMYGPLFRENQPQPAQQQTATQQAAAPQSGYAGADQQPAAPASPPPYTPHPRRPPMPQAISPITGEFQPNPQPLVTQWEGAILGTPSNRESPMPTGRDKAIQGVAQVFQEHGIDERQQEQAEREGFL